MGRTFAQLRRDSATSLYQQIADQLSREIASGHYKPHEKLPTELALSELYAVSRITVRQAMHHLVAQGLVTRKQGKGSFVTGPVVRHELRELKGFIEGMSTQGVQPERRLIDFGLATGNSHAAERLGAKGGHLLRMRRLFTIKGVPFAVSEVHLPAEAAAKVSREMAESLSAYDILGQYLNVNVTRADLVIRARPAGREHAKLLKISDRASLLAIERLSFGANGVPCEHLYFWTRSENYEVSVSAYGKMSIVRAAHKP